MTEVSFCADIACINCVMMSIGCMSRECLVVSFTCIVIDDSHGNSDTISGHPCILDQMGVNVGTFL
jgi:hypothetical protein